MNKLKNYNEQLIDNSLGMLSSGPDFLDFLWDYAHTFLNTFFISNGDFSYSSDTFLDKLWIDLVHILLELFQYWLVILVVDDSGKDLYFLILDVIRVGKFREEALHLVL